MDVGRVPITRPTLQQGPQYHSVHVLYFREISIERP